jgi:hypothetical protein
MIKGSILNNSLKNHYLYNGMNSYQLTPEKRQNENNTIQQILINNGYNNKVSENRLTTTKPKQVTNKTRWTKFTYTGKETRAVTKVFKNTNLKIAYSTNNTMGKLPTAKLQQSKCKYEKCGVYQITCPTCNMRYVGQRGRPFKIRFREHLHDFEYKNGKSRFAQHLIDNGHSIGRMEDIMETLHIPCKGKMMDTLEK